MTTRNIKSGSPPRGLNDSDRPTTRPRDVYSADITSGTDVRQHSAGKSNQVPTRNHRYPTRDHQNPRAHDGNTADRAGQLTLKPHQRTAVEKLAVKELGSRLIGDEMRVGKTPTAIAIDQSLRSQVARKQRGNNSTLIVCPKSVIGVWSHHLTWMGVSPNQICTIDLPSKQALKAQLVKIADAKRTNNAVAYYVIINWDAVQTIRNELQRAGPWFHIIGDEIHRIKGRTTKRTACFKRIKGKQKTGLSGTPADNRPEDFWSVLNWLRPQDYSSYWDFVDTYCTWFVTRSGYKRITGVKKAALVELRQRLEPFYIRRLLADVAEYMPQKQYRTIEVAMGVRQHREYDAFCKDDIVEISGGDILADYEIVKITRQQQMAIGCCAGEWIKRKKKNKVTGKWEPQDYFDVHITDKPASPKLDAIMEYIDDESESGPFIALAQHRDTIRLLAGRLEGRGYKVSRIDGTNTADERRDGIRRFQSAESDIFLGTIGATREGVDLSRANTIIFVDRAWNPNWNRQAEARADALDNCLPVTIVYFQTKDSIDEHRRLRIEQKGRDTDAITSI